MKSSAYCRKHLVESGYLKKKGEKTNFQKCQIGLNIDSSINWKWFPITRWEELQRKTVLSKNGQIRETDENNLKF